MGGIGDCIAATGILSFLARQHGALEVYGGGLQELLYLPNITVKDDRRRLSKERETDFTISIEPKSGYTHFKQHLLYHFGNQVGLPRVVRRPHLCTNLSTNYVLQHFGLPYKNYVVVSRFAGWGPRVPADQDLNMVIGLLKKVTGGMKVVEVGHHPNPNNISLYTDVNLVNRTSLPALYHLLDGAAYIFTLDTMVYHLAMERHLTSRVFCWWGNIPPDLRAYPGSIDYHNGRCVECCLQYDKFVPSRCVTGTLDCLQLDLDLVTPLLRDLVATFPSYLNNGNAKGFIEDVALEYCQGQGLDVGAGKYPLTGAIPIDQGDEADAYRLHPYTDDSMDFVFSSHCLEHLDHWQQALKEWLRVLKRGGTLFLYLPHEKMTMWLPGSPWVGEDHRWIPTWKRVSDFLAHHNTSIINCCPQPDRSYGFWGAFSKN